MWHRLFILPPTHYRQDRSYHKVQGALPSHLWSFVKNATGNAWRNVPLLAMPRRAALSQSPGRVTLSPLEFRWKCYWQCVAQRAAPCNAAPRRAAVQLAEMETRMQLIMRSHTCEDAYQPMHVKGDWI